MHDNFGYCGDINNLPGLTVFLELLIFLSQKVSYVIRCHLTCSLFLISGTTTDGEFCSLRPRGETRVIHVWQLIHDAKDSVRRKSKATLLKMLIAIDCKWLEYMNSFFKLQSSVYTIIFVRKLLYISLCSLQGVFMQL